MTADVSRNFADRDKLYHATVRQQGRLPTDAEENHAGELADWGHDAEFIETLTALGTPDDGFRIVVPPGVDDGFDVLAGSYYLGGSRVENTDAIAYADQITSNWLTLDEPVVPGGRILVWLEMEERVVSAVEDSELLEPALRGADGAARTRRCWRVRQAPTGAADCQDALRDVLSGAEAAALDGSTGALRGTGTLTIGFDDTDVDLDLCKPAVEPGYLGNRNNCYRIKRTGSDHFVWGEDNAAQLYRVTVGADPRTIRFLTEPRDEYLRPRPGQTVELLRGDVLLPNYERIAELDGDLFRVTGGYQEGTITVDSDVDPDWLTWLAGSPLDPQAPPGTERHLYLRVWTGGGSGADPAVPFVEGTALTLVGTGLTVTFDGPTLPGAGWTVSARPDAPLRVLPWSLRDGARAHGPRRHVAALALVDLATGEVHDCRDTFRPLHRIRSCCTVTVGPPGTNGGDVDSIADALTRIPPGGGTICLLAGEHPANVVIEGRRDLRFTGCPGKTSWVAADPDDPLVTIVDTRGVSFCDIAFQSGAAPAILAARPDPSAEAGDHGDLVVQDCRFVAPAGCAVLARSMDGATLRRCEVVAGPFPEATRLPDFASLPAVFLQGQQLLLDRCVIAAPLGRREAPGRLALGTLQIGGGSSGVTIRDCRVRDGAGIGIVLGSITFVPVDRPRYSRDPAGALAQAVRDTAAHGGSIRDGWQSLVTGFLHVTGDAGCIGVEPVDPDPGDNGDGDVQVPVSDGIVEDVEILHTHVLRMGSSGIATYPLGLAVGGTLGDAIAVSGLLVADCLVSDCLRFEVNVADARERAFHPVGGIALAVALGCEFRDNEIVNNGRDFGGGTCGIGIAYGEDVRVVDNLIEGNGRYDPDRSVTGPNAGIHLGAVRPGLGRGAGTVMASGGTTGLSVHGNHVSQPAGRAVRALAVGPVMVDDNRFVGGNRSRLFAELMQASSHLGYARGLRSSDSGFDLSRADLVLDLLGGDAVTVLNLALSTDLVLERRDRTTGVNLATTLAQVASPTAAFAQLATTDTRRFGGPTMFHDNQVSLHRPIPDGPPMSLCSILLVSFDDVGFADNQVGIEPDTAFAVFDALIVGVTARVTANRAQEAAPVVASIASLALLWTTAALNQTSRTVLAVGLAGTVEQFNQHG